MKCFRNFFITIVSILLLLITIMVSNIICAKPKPKPKQATNGYVITYENNVYHCNRYTLMNGCVQFYQTPMNKSRIFCGTFSIERDGE